MESPTKEAVSETTSGKTTDTVEKGGESVKKDERRKGLRCTKAAWAFFFMGLLVSLVHARSQKPR